MVWDWPMKLRRQAVRGPGRRSSRSRSSDGLLGRARHRPHRHRRGEEGTRSRSRRRAGEDRGDGHRFVLWISATDPRWTPPRPSASSVPRRHGVRLVDAEGGADCNAARGARVVRSPRSCRACDLGLPAGRDAHRAGEPPRHGDQPKLKPQRKDIVDGRPHGSHGASPARSPSARPLPVRPERGGPGRRRAREPAPADARVLAHGKFGLRARVHHVPRAEGGPATVT